MERYAPDVLVTTAVAAGLIGRSVFTLQRARCDRPDLRMPLPLRVGRRGVRYSLMELVWWCAERGERLRWLDVPTSVLLPAFNLFAGTDFLRVSADLAGRVRGSKP
ncbi:hypothetical protein [Rhizobacter fulvus]